MIISKSLPLKKNLKCDALIIGSGAGGSISSLLLSKRNLKVIIIEEGNNPNLIDNNISEQKKMRFLYRNGGAQPIFGKNTIGYGEGSCVGGSTYVNAGYLFKTPENVIDEWSQKKLLNNNFIDNIYKNYNYIEKLLNKSIHISNNDNLDSEILKNVSLKKNYFYTESTRGIINCKNKNKCFIGCPSGAKQSTLISVLPKSVENGVDIYHQTKAIKINYNNNKFKTFVSSEIKKNNLINASIESKYLIVSCGPTQSPQILSKSRLVNINDKYLQYHSNLKVLAKFGKKIYPENASVSTFHIREFEKQRMIFSASNFNMSQIAATYSHLSFSDIENIFKNKDYFGFYVMQIRNYSKAKFLKLPFNNYMLNSNNDRRDQDLLKYSIIKSAEILFNAGALELFFPIYNSKPVNNMNDVTKLIKNLDYRNIELVSVHGMSSFGINFSKKININGQINNKIKNLYVFDASLIPTSTGESPQLTLMSIIKSIIDENEFTK